MAAPVFSEAHADRACKFIEQLRFVEGEWAGKPFRLEEWQKGCVVRPLFGMVDPDTGLRRYRTAFIAIPRKNAKSTLAAALALYFLFADGEFGAQIYSAAADRDQASLVFRIAAEMIRRHPVLSRKCQIIESRKRIIYQTTNSFYEALSSDVDTAHGLNAHAIIFDELHTQANRNLWDVLKTSMGSRRQPLLLQITTAGYDRESICWEQWEYADRLLRGEIVDDSYFARIWAASPEDDWKDPATWHKANPNLGVSIKEEFLHDECERAKNSPSYQNTFRRLFLNQWTQQNERYVDLDAWAATAGAVDFGALRGRECYGAFDLSATTDLSALLFLFPWEDGLFKVVSKFYIPANRMRERSDRDRVPYEAWVRDGFITATPGDVIDYAFIKADILEAAEEYNLREVAYDRYLATQLVTELGDAGLTMVPFGQGYAMMSPATKEWYRLVLEKRWHHGNNPVLNWMAGNVQVKSDPAGNIKPNKAQSTARIDGIVAGIMATDRALRNTGQGRSVYDSEGIFII